MTTNVETLTTCKPLPLQKGDTWVWNPEATDETPETYSQAITEYLQQGVPIGTVVRKHRRPKSDPWISKIPWHRKW